MPASKKIWIVDDDPHIRAVFRLALLAKGYRVAVCEDGRMALDQLKTDSASLFILDVDMPRMDGWQTLAELRRRGCTQPVLMVTASNNVSARIRGLENGADDYIGKPCDAEELCARVAALLRRAKPSAPAPSAVLQFGEVKIDLESKKATKAGAPLRLTRTDYAVLLLLHQHLGRPVSRELILQRIWDGQSGSSHALDTHLWRLRRKIGDTDRDAPLIRNLTGVGYVMELLN